MLDVDCKTPPVEKVLGADFELANSYVGFRASLPDPDWAAEQLLEQFSGFPLERRSFGTTIELGRRFLAENGGSWYIDSGHLEGNTPEALSASEHMVQLHAALRLARQAQQNVNRQLGCTGRIDVLANNTDGQGSISYGAHKSVLTTGDCFQNVCGAKPHIGCFLATHLVTSVIYSGQGTVGAKNGRPACNFQLSSRADFFEKLWDVTTTQHRPLINTRHEPHAQDGLARLHVIFHDMTLSPTATWLTAGALQAVVALCELGIVDPALILDDPVGAALQISRDLSLREPLRTIVRGRVLSAVEIQQGICDLVAECHADGLLQHAVPELDRVLEAWRNMLERLRIRELEALAAHTDNWLKYLLLDRRRGRRGLTWQSAEMQVLDLQYSNLDPEQGLFWQMAAAAQVAGIPDETVIAAAMTEPPANTRAYLRAHLLRRFGRLVSNMDWSWLSFRIPEPRGWWRVARLDMPDPRRFGESETRDALARRTLEDVVGGINELQSPEPAPSPRDGTDHCVTVSS